MNWKLDFGPWTTIMEGKFRGHSIELLENNENFFVSIIYDEKEGKKVGALIEGHKTLLARGSAENFIQTLPKPAIIIEKTLGEETFKLFFVSTDSIYVDFRQEDYLRGIDKIIKAGMEDANTIIELARTSSLELREIAMSPESEYSPVLGDPFTARALLSGLKKSALELIDLGDGIVPHPRTLIPLGLNKKREIIKEKNVNLFKTIITGEEKGRLYATYILAENFLLENRTGIIFDDTNYFTGLASASKNDLELKESLVEYEPAGFPVKNFTAKKDFKISMGDSDLHLLLQMLGVGDEEFSKKFTLKALEETFNTPDELIEKIKEMSELNDFQKLKAERITQIIKQQYANLFGQSMSIAELTKKWPGNLGRATIINTKELSNDEKIIFVQTIMHLLDKEVRNERNDRVMFFIPHADKELSFGIEKLTGVINRLQGLGIGFIFGAENFMPQLDDSINARINVVSANDVAVSIKGINNYRVSLRPSLSGSPAY
jgi:hypothetical protein